MTREEIRARIEEIGIIPAIRVSTAEDAVFAAEAVSESAIPIVEVTMTVPGAIDVIGELTRRHPEVLVGAGTLFRVDTARRCLDAGAGFLTMPGLDLDIVNFALGRGVVVLPGALTPTEEERMIRELILQMKLGHVHKAYFQGKFGVDIQRRFAGSLGELQDRGFLGLDDHSLRLSRDGLLQVDRLLHEFFLPQHRDARYS